MGVDFFYLFSQTNCLKSLAHRVYHRLFVVGVCAVITPVAFEAAFIKDTVVAIVAAIMLLLCVVKNKKLTKTGGIIMLVSYAVYFAYILYMNYR